MNDIDPSQAALYHSVEWEGKIAVLEGNLNAKSELMTKLNTENKLLQSRLQSTRLELGMANASVSQSNHELERLRGDNNNLLELVSKLENANTALQQDYIAKLEYEHGINTKIRQLSYKLNVDMANSGDQNSTNNNNSSPNTAIAFTYINGSLQPIDPTHVQQLQDRVQQLEEKLRTRHQNYEELLNKFETQHFTAKTTSLDLRSKLSHEANLNSTLKQQYALLQKNYREMNVLIANHDQSLKTLQTAYDGLLLDFNTTAIKLQHTEEREKHAINRGNLLDVQSQELLRAESVLKAQIQQLKMTNTNYEHEYNKLSKVYGVLRSQYDDKNARLFRLLAQNQLKVEKNEYQIAIDACIGQTSTKYITKAHLNQLLLETHNVDPLSTTPDTIPPHTQHQLHAQQQQVVDQLHAFVVEHYDALAATTAPSTTPTTPTTSTTTTSTSDQSKPLILLENGLVMTPVGLIISIPVLYRQHTELLNQHRQLLIHNDENSQKLLEIQSKMTNILTEMQSKLDHSKEIERRKHQDEIDRLNLVIQMRDDELEVTKRNKNQLSQQLQVLIRSKLGASNFTPGSVQASHGGGNLNTTLNTTSGGFNTSFGGAQRAAAVGNTNPLNTSTMNTSMTSSIIDSTSLSWTSVDELQSKYEGLINELYRFQVQNASLVAQNDSNLNKLAQSNNKLEELGQQTSKLTNELQRLRTEQAQQPQLSPSNSNNSMMGDLNTTINTTATTTSLNPTDDSTNTPNPWQLELSTAQTTIQTQQGQIGTLTATIAQNEVTISNLGNQSERLKLENRQLEGKLSTAEEIQLKSAEKIQAYFFELTTLKSTLATLQFQHDQQKQRLDNATAGQDKAQNTKIVLQAEVLTLKSDLSNLKHDLTLLQSQYDDLNSIYKLAKVELDGLKSNEIDFNQQLVKVNESYQNQIKQLLEKVQLLSNQREELIIKLQSGFSTPMEYHGNKNPLNQRPSSPSSSSSAPFLPPTLLPSYHHQNNNLIHSNQQSAQFQAIGESITLKEQLRTYQEKYSVLEKDYHNAQNLLKTLQESINNDKLHLRSQILEQQQLVTTLQGEKNALVTCVDQLKLKVRAIITHRLHQAGILVKPMSAATIMSTTPSNLTPSANMTTGDESTPTTTLPIAVIPDLPTTSLDNDAQQQQVAISIAQLEDMITLTSQAKMLQTQVLSLQTELESVTEALKTTTQAHTGLQLDHTSLQSTYNALVTECQAAKNLNIELNEKLQNEIAQHEKKSMQCTETTQNLLLLQAQYNTMTEERNKLQIELKTTFDALTESRSELEMAQINHSNTTQQLHLVQNDLESTTRQLENAQNQSETQAALLTTSLSQLQAQFDATKAAFSEKETLLKQLEAELKKFEHERVQGSVKFDDLFDSHTKLEMLYQKANAELVQFRDGLGDTGAGLDGAFGMGMGAGIGGSINNCMPNQASGNENESQLITSLRLDKDELIQQLESLKLQSDQLKGTNNHSTQQLEAAQSQLSSITNLYTTLQDTHDELKAKLTTLHTEFTQISNTNVQLQQRVQTLTDENHSLAKSNAELVQGQGVTNDTTTKPQTFNNGQIQVDSNGDCIGCNELQVKLTAQQSVSAQRVEQLSLLHKQYKILVDAKYIIAKEQNIETDTNTTMCEDNNTPSPNKEGTKQRQYVLELLKMESKLKNMLIREDIETQELTQIYTELTENRAKLTQLVQDMNQTRVQLTTITKDHEQLGTDMAEMVIKNRELNSSLVQMADKNEQLNSHLDHSKQDIDQQRDQNSIQQTHNEELLTQLTQLTAKYDLQTAQLDQLQLSQPLIAPTTTIVDDAINTASIFNDIDIPSQITTTTPTVLTTTPTPSFQSIDENEGEKHSTETDIPDVHSSPQDNTRSTQTSPTKITPPPLDDHDFVGIEPQLAIKRKTMASVDSADDSDNNDEVTNPSHTPNKKTKFNTPGVSHAFSDINDTTAPLQPDDELSSRENENENDIVANDDNETKMSDDPLVQLSSAGMFHDEDAMGDENIDANAAADSVSEIEFTALDSQSEHTPTTEQTQPNLHDDASREEHPPSPQPTLAPDQTVIDSLTEVSPTIEESNIEQSAIQIPAPDSDDISAFVPITTMNDNDTTPNDAEELPAQGITMGDDELDENTLGEQDTPDTEQNTPDDEQNTPDEQKGEQSNSEEKQFQDDISGDAEFDLEQAQQEQDDDLEQQIALLQQESSLLGDVGVFMGDNDGDDNGYDRTLTSPGTVIQDIGSTDEPGSQTDESTPDLQDDDDAIVIGHDNRDELSTTGEMNTGGEDGTFEHALEATIEQPDTENLSPDAADDNIQSAIITDDHIQTDDNASSSDPTNEFTEANTPPPQDEPQNDDVDQEPIF